jgi:uncharacterized caspase-like protein
MFHLSPRNILIASSILLFLQVAVHQPAFAEIRVALVIGQSAYLAVPPLPNPANDAKKITELLGNAGFEVTAVTDLSQEGMQKAVSNFAAKVAASGPDTVALVFYAGHGLQIDGENYLVPVDVDPKREADIPLQAVRLNDLMNTLGALPTRMRIVMLDACRDNPFPAINATAGHGLAIVDTKAGAAGSFISYSTAPGAVAEDGAGSNSPYTTALLSSAMEPNLPIEEAFKRVRVAVNQVTEGRQVPWESSSLTAEFKFFSGDQVPGQERSGQGQTAAARNPQSAARSVDDWRKELRGKEPKVAYDLVIADNSVAAFEAFVVLFAQPPYNVRVRGLLERRYVMEAWSTAVAINTAASFQAFLETYPDSDLAATARKMRERVRNRSLPPSNVALGPSCPCPVQPPQPAQPLKKKVEEPAPRKSVSTQEKPKPTRGYQPRAYQPGGYQPEGNQQPGIPSLMPGIGIGVGGAFGGGRVGPTPHGYGPGHY